MKGKLINRGIILRQPIDLFNKIYQINNYNKIDYNNNKKNESEEKKSLKKPEGFNNENQDFLINKINSQKEKENNNKDIISEKNTISVVFFLGHILIIQQQVHQMVL